MPSTKVDTDTGIRTAEWSKAERAALCRAAGLLEDEVTILDRNRKSGTKRPSEAEAVLDLARLLMCAAVLRTPPPKPKIEDPADE